MNYTSPLFNMTHLNSRCLPAYMSHFYTYLNKLSVNCGLIGLCETWHTADNTEPYTMDGYNHGS